MPSEPGSILDDLDRIKELPPEFTDRVEARKNGVPTATKAAPKKASTPAPAYKEGMFVEPIGKIYALMGLLVLPFKENTGVTLMENSESCALAWDQWAKTSPKVRKALAPLLNAGGFGQVAIAHAPIAMAAVAEMAPKYAAAMMRAGSRIGEMMGQRHDVNE